MCISTMKTYMMDSNLKDMSFQQHRTFAHSHIFYTASMHACMHDNCMYKFILIFITIVSSNTYLSMCTFHKLTRREVVKKKAH